MSILNPPAMTSRLSTNLDEVIVQLGLTANVQFVYDSGRAASVPSAASEYWYDLSGQGYNAINGTSAANTHQNFLFSGNPGLESSAEYWYRNDVGGSLFRIPTNSWLESLHKDNAKGTWIVWYLQPSSSSGGFRIMNYDGSSSVGGVVNGGWDFGMVGANQSVSGYTIVAGEMVMAVWGASNNLVSLIQIGNDKLAPYNTWNFASVAIDEQAGTYSLRLNDWTRTGSLTYNSPMATNTNRDVTVLRNSNDQNMVLRWAGMAAWSRKLSDADIEAVYQATKLRFYP